MARYTLGASYHAINAEGYGAERPIPGYSTSLIKARAKAIQHILRHRLDHVWVYKDGEYIGKVHDNGRNRAEFIYSEDNGRYGDYVLNLSGTVKKRY